MSSTSGYTVKHDKKPRKRLSAPTINLALDRSEGSILSDELDESTELDLDDIDTPSDNSNEFEWEGERFDPHQSNRNISVLAFSQIWSPACKKSKHLSYLLRLTL